MRGQHRLRVDLALAGNVLEDVEGVLMRVSNDPLGVDATFEVTVCLTPEEAEKFSEELARGAAVARQRMKEHV